jgi:hypothetical protein
MGLDSKTPRVSAFVEVGLLDNDSSSTTHGCDQTDSSRELKSRRCSRPPSVEIIEEEEEDWEDTDFSSDDESLGKPGAQVPILKASTSTRKSYNFIARHTMLIGLVLLVVLLTSTSALSRTIVPPADAVGDLRKRANSPTDVCKRWSQQSAIINGTLYLYGGRATTSSSQSSNEWSMICRFRMI